MTDQQKQQVIDFAESKGYKFEPNNDRFKENLLYGNFMSFRQMAFLYWSARLKERNEKTNPQND